MKKLEKLFHKNNVYRKLPVFTYYEKLQFGGKACQGAPKHNTRWYLQELKKN